MISFVEKLITKIRGPRTCCDFTLCSKTNANLSNLQIRTANPFGFNERRVFYQLTASASLKEKSKENSSPNKRLCSLCLGNLGPLLNIAGIHFESLFAMFVSLPPFPSRCALMALLLWLEKEIMLIWWMVWNVVRRGRGIWSAFWEHKCDDGDIFVKGLYGIPAQWVQWHSSVEYRSYSSHVIPIFLPRFSFSPGQLRN